MTFLSSILKRFELSTLFGGFFSESHCFPAYFFKTQIFIHVLSPLGIIEGLPLNERYEALSFNITKVLSKNLKSFYFYFCIGNHTNTSLIKLIGSVIW